MEKYEIEERLHKVFKNSLDMKAQWIFKIQSTILMVSSTIFAVMVSLANVSNGSLCNRVLLASAILLNSVCTLFASISLFENRAMSNALSRISYNKIVEYRMGILGIDSSSSKQYVERKPIFAFCEKASYVSFLLFVLALTACAIYKICYT